MKDLQHVKAIAEQMFSLSSELLRLVDMDETERRLFLEEVKKKKKCGRKGAIFSRREKGGRTATKQYICSKIDFLFY